MFTLPAGRLMRRSALSAVVIALAGCMTGPDYARPDVDVPQTWSSAREGGEIDGPALVTAWWKSMGDPVLDTLVERAVAENFDLEIAESRVREARAARGIAASALLPNVGVNASASYNQSIEQDFGGGDTVSGGLSNGPNGPSSNVTVRSGDLTISRNDSAAGSTSSISLTPGASDTPDRTDNLFQVGFDASWELDVFGGNRRAIEAAEADIEVANEFRRDVLVSLLSEVALNYIDLRTAQTRLAITQKNIEAQSQSVRITEDRFNAGLSSELDAFQARALLASTQSQVPLLRTQIAAAIHRLGVLVGDDPGALKEELSASSPLPGGIEGIPIGLPSDLLRRRADIRRAERELAAQTARIGVAMADLYPRFFLTGSLSGMSSTAGSVLSGANQFWSIGPGISWPIFQGGRIRANIEVQNEREEQAAINYGRSIMNALEDVENSLVAYAQEQLRQDAVQAAVEANEAAVRISNERYVSGLESFLNVILAQQSLFNTEDQLVQSQRAELTYLVSLYKALGGGWEVFEDETETASSAETVSETN